MIKSPLRLITILCLCGILIWFIITPDVAFSQKENRNLASFPEVSVDTVSDGTFMNEMETYLTDQFPARDWCVSFRTNVLNSLGSQLVNNVFLAKDQYLIAKTAPENPEKIDSILQAVNRFAETTKDVKVNFMLVPNSIYVYEDKLPYGYVSDQKKIIDDFTGGLSKEVSVVNVADTLKSAANDTEPLYYHTDHHWTSHGAYLAFSEFAKTAGLDTTNISYDIYRVTNGFQGTQSSNAGIYSIFDSIDFCVPNPGNDYVITDSNGPDKRTSFFDESKLNEKDKYLFFLGGNCAKVTISTTNTTGRNLLVLKDSFANCFLPMLTPYYDKIVVVDPRYYYDDIQQTISDNKINEVLFLYNVDSLNTDNSLVDVLDNFDK